MKKWIALLLSLCLMTGIASAVAESTEAAAGKTPMQEKLEKLEGVSRVEVIQPAEGATYFSERYLLIFEQPLDWQDPSKGTFPQRVVLCLSEDAEINVMETQGYCLPDYTIPESLRESMNVLGMDLLPEMVNLVTKSGNYINVEHRFFGGSRPADMSNTDTKYWEYHTPENAANDYHRIYTALAPILGDRWVSVGTSRGGLMTNVYAKYFPEDMNVYIPYVAPCSDGLEGRSMYKFVYEEIGNAPYGEEAAAENRGIVTDFQVELMKRKKELLPSYANFIQGQGMLFQNGLEDFSQLYDLAVLEFAVQMWQNSANHDFGSLKTILEMPEETEEQKVQKINAIFVKFITVQNPQDWSYSFAAWPYNVNTAMYYGQYWYDFSYLPKAMEKAGVENTLSVSPEQEKDIPWSILFTPEQRAAFTYDGGAFRKELLDDMNTTKAKHLMIFGISDPWLSQAVPEEATSGNENIRRYINPNHPHDAKISNMPEETKNEIISLLTDWLSMD